MNKIVRWVKNWTLPLAMFVGVTIYFSLHLSGVSTSVKHCLLGVSDTLMPVLIFLMLYFTFCKIKIADLRPLKWHGVLFGVQILISCAIVVVINFFPLSPSGQIWCEGALSCVLCPTAMAAAVITGKLGGNAASLATFTLESNILAAVMIPLLCPLVHTEGGANGWILVCLLSYKVFWLLVVPFFASLATKFFLPQIHACLLRLRDISFYLWGFSLTIVTAQAARLVAQEESEGWNVLVLAAVAFVVCSSQFFIGKLLGGHYGERISGGQALGQKNTIFGMWFSMNYLSPLSSVAMGVYILAQNLINSWQLWRRQKGRLA